MNPAWLKSDVRFRAVGLLAVLTVGGASPAMAHDFWLQLSAYWVQPGGVTPLTLQVGHGPSRQRSPIPLQRITRFQAIGLNGVSADLRGRLRPGGTAQDGDVALLSPGAQLLVLQTDDRAQTHLPVLRFNDYLKVEGLTPALDQRIREHRMDRDASENYSRCAKALLQVGPVKAGDQAQVTRPVGLPLEIVPERSPYAEPRSSSLPVRVLYEGRPLAGALVKLTRLEDDAAPFETHRTDGAGRAVFSMPTSGTWLLNVIWTKAQPRSAETDFETTFSSFSFGFPPARVAGTDGVPGAAR
jgi:uncharacterized GH25 family protein